MHIKILLLLFLGFQFSLFSQNEVNDKKAQKFGKKTILYMNYGDMSKFMPDEDQQAYIAEKTGKNLEAFKKEVDQNLKKINEDVKFLNDNGIARIFDEVEIDLISKEPIIKADLIVKCHYKEDKFELVYKNCYQVDKDWVFGDAIIPRGEGVDEIVAKHEAKQEKASNLSIGRQNTVSSKEDEAENKAYKAKLFQMKNADPATQYIQFDKIDMPLNGYYIKENGVKHDAVIAYQVPEKLMNNSFDLVILKEANGQKVDAHNPGNDPNHLKYVSKKNLKAFYVGGQLFIKLKNGSWRILKEEGAIRKLVRFEKLDNADLNYQVIDEIQKLDEDPLATAGLTITFKSNMSDMVKENEALAQKVENKEKGYRLMQMDDIIEEFNKWYDENNPGVVDYIFDDERPGFDTFDQFGKTFVNFVNAGDKNRFSVFVAMKDEITSTVNAKTKDADMKSSLLKEMGDNFNEEIGSENEERVSNLLKSVGDKQLTFVETKFERNEISDKVGFDIGRGYIFVKDNQNKAYKIRFEKVYKLKDSWRTSEIGSRLIEETKNTPDKAMMDTVQEPQMVITGKLGKSSFGTPTISITVENNSSKEVTGFMYTQKLLDKDGNVIKESTPQVNKMYFSMFTPKPQGVNGGLEPGYKGSNTPKAINGLSDEEKSEVDAVEITFKKVF